jgi:hypothetical protein
MCARGIRHWPTPEPFPKCSLNVTEGRAHLERGGEHYEALPVQRPDVGKIVDEWVVWRHVPTPS